jgi:hypothetical protein
MTGGKENESLLKEDEDQEEEDWEYKPEYDGYY